MIMQEENTRNIEILQDTTPLWAIGPEAERRGEDAATRKPDFVVYKYESDLAGRMVDDYDLNTFPNHGFFEHTIVECKRRISNDHLDDILDQLEEQCMRIENPRKCCFAIALKGFRIWFFEYIGEIYDHIIPKNQSFRGKGFHFLRPHGGYLYWQEAISAAGLDDQAEGILLGNGLRGWDLLADGLIIDHIFRYMSSYNQPLGYNHSK